MFKLALLLLAAVGAVVAQDEVKPVDLAVIEGTTENFDELTNGSRNVLVAFTATWCGHCKALKPEYEIAAKAFKDEADSIAFVNVDAEAHPTLRDRFDVTGFPTIKYFLKGAEKEEAYDGPREAAGIVEWVNDKFGGHGRIQKPRTFVKVLTDATFNDIVMDKEKNVLVEFFAPWCGHCKSLAPIYEQVAATFQSESKCIVASVDATTEEATAKRFGVEGFPTLKFFSTENKEGEAYGGGRSEEDLIKFLNEKCGTFRVAGGMLSEEAGRVAALDDIAVKIASGEDIKKMSEKMAQEAEKFPTGKTYLKAIKKISAKGLSFVETEITRLSNMITKGQMKVEKRDDFQYRLNILKAFRKEEL